MYSFTDETGNVIVWWASSRPRDNKSEELRIGSTYTFDGTVKGHDEYNGLKQTKVNRCAKFTLVE